MKRWLWTASPFAGFGCFAFTWARVDWWSCVAVFVGSILLGVYANRAHARGVDEGLRIADRVDEQMITEEVQRRLAGLRRAN